MRHALGGMLLTGAILVGGRAGVAEECTAPKCSPQQCGEDRMARAGHSNEISKWARCTYHEGYLGYYVGGGARVRGRGGEARYCHEGTFGVDYAPIVPGFRDAVALNWWHGKHYQGGGGQYEPEHKNRPFANFRRNRAGESHGESHAGGHGDGHEVHHGEVHGEMHDAAH